MAYKHDFNVFVGAKTGVFKGVKLNESAVIEKNLSGLKLNPVEDEITAIAWGDEEEKEILLGLVNQTVKVFNSDLQDFTSIIDVKCGTGPLRGVCKYGSSVLTAVDSGEVKLWSDNSPEGTELTIKTGSKIDRMRHNPFNKDVIAVGGVEADLSLWNLEAEDKCIFKAKNVPHNYLELRVPIWVSDIAFMPDGQKIATCSRHGHLRLYDPKAQRRPVLNMQIPEQALTAISPCSREHHVIVGSGTGLMMLVDMRGKGLELNRYKGFAGGVRDIVCHPSEPYIMSVSLDRFLRLHHLETKTLLHKVYLKSKLNCALMRSNFSLKDTAPTTAEDTSKPNQICTIGDDSDEKSVAKREMDELFSEMEANGKDSGKDKLRNGLSNSTKKAKRKKDIASMPPHKKKKKILKQ